MIPRIKDILPIENYIFSVVFDDGRKVLCDATEDMDTIKSYALLRED